MARTALTRIAVLTVVGILGSAGSALAWNMNGQQNGWGNKNDRGCPTQYTLVAVTFSTELSDLNGDGLVCQKFMNNNNNNYTDDISNH